MNRTQKTELIETLHATFSEAASVVVAHQVGLTVVESSALRNKMREGGARFKVTKNRIAKIALKDTPYEDLTDQFTGPTAIGTSGDPVTAAKILVEFAKENDKLTIICGAIGAQVLDKAEVEALAKLPSLDELRAKLVGLLQAPATKLARIAQEPASQLARVVHAKPGQADEGAAEPEKAEEAPAEPEQAAEGAAEPEKAAESAVEPEKADEGAAEPEKADEGAAEPEKADEGAAAPEKAEESAAEPEQTEEGA